MVQTDVNDVDPNGDVVLICGDPSQRSRITRTRVSSAIMGYSSSVFKAMFSGRFKEGREITCSGMAEVSLPDDDPEMMLILCQILHLRHDAVPRTLKPLQLLKLAELCDKYDCAIAIKPSAGEWATGILQQATDSERGCLLTAACLLQHGALVQRIAADLVMNSSSPVDEIGTIGDGVWLNIPSAIECKRLAMHREVSMFVEKRIDDQVKAKTEHASCVESCPVGAKRIASLLEQLRNSGLWPVSTSGKPLNRLLTMMESIKVRDPRDLARCEAKLYCLHEFHKLQNGGVSYSHAAGKIRQSAQEIKLAKPGP
ncbi:hypothetical protein LTR85_003032 [Meristemomyces frigidus]|nr:hypothetical protein LTR85_003032 [Meristemomyces frigidus]